MIEPENQRDNINNIIHWQKVKVEGNDILVLVTRRLTKGGFENANETWTFREDAEKGVNLIKEFKQLGGVHKETYRMLNVLADFKEKEVLEDV